MALVVRVSNFVLHFAQKTTKMKDVRGIFMEGYGYGLMCSIMMHHGLILWKDIKHSWYLIR